MFLVKWSVSGYTWLVFLIKGVAAEGTYSTGYVFLIKQTVRENLSNRADSFSHKGLICFSHYSS